MRAWVLLLVCACTRPPEAPNDLSGIARYVYREENPAVGIAKLEALLANVAEDTVYDARHWELDRLSDADLLALPEHPGRPLDHLIGSAVAASLPGSLACYAELQTRTDQRPMEPTAKTLQREMLSDPACFLARTCPLQTQQDGVRSTLVLETSFVQRKDFRWVTYSVDGEMRRAFYGRAWLAESREASGQTKLWQSYGLDVFIERPHDVLRFFAAWNDTDVYVAGILVDDATELATVASATEGIFNAGRKLCP